MKGWSHAALGVGLGIGVASLEGQSLRGGLDEIALCTVAALGPDVDRSTSLLGRLIPEKWWPTETWELPGTHDVRSGRWAGPFLVQHHGATHSIAVGLLLALPWLLLGHPEFARVWLLAWCSHLLGDGASKQQLLWPLSRRWLRLWPLGARGPELAAQALAAFLLVAGLTGRLHA